MNARSSLIAALCVPLLGLGACGASSLAAGDAAVDAVDAAPESGGEAHVDVTVDAAKESKPPFEAGAMNDVDTSSPGASTDTPTDSFAGGVCGGERPTCVRPDGNFGICTPQKTCGTCTTTEDCRSAYGGGFQCSPDHECFPLV